jgi:hypothetical protein
MVDNPHDIISGEILKVSDKQSYFRKVDPFAILVLIYAGIIVSFGYNIYFFLDDYPYFHITENLIAYPHELAKLFYSYDVWGYYRPLVKLIWIAGYLLWGTSTIGYTSVIAFFFIITIYTLYKTGVLLKGRLCGLITSLFYASYYPVVQGSWHKAGVSAYSEICFISLFLYFTVKWIKKSENRFDSNALLGMLFIFLAIISKEASLLLPLTLIPFFRMKKIRYFILITFSMALITFFIPRFFFISYGPLHHPGFHPDKIFFLFDNFIKNQYLTLIGPYTLIIAFFSFRKRHSFSMLGIFLLTLIVERFFVSPSRLPSRLDLVLTITALLVSFIYTSDFKRFMIFWSVIMLAPSFSMGDANIHQTFESCIGVSFLLGLGFSDQIIMLKRLLKKLIRRKTKIQIIKHWLNGKLLRNTALVLLIPMTIYSVAHIIKINLKDSSARYIYIRDSSQLTKLVREYLQEILPKNAHIHNNTMPAHISYPDLEYDLNLNGRMDIKSDDDVEKGDGYIIISGNLDEPVQFDFQQDKNIKKIREFISGNFFTEIYFRNEL